MALAPIRCYRRAKDRLDKLANVHGWVIHDTRRTIATGLADAGVSIEVAANEVSEAYLKTKKERMGHLLERV